MIHYSNIQNISQSNNIWWVSLFLLWHLNSTLKISKSGRNHLMAKNLNRSLQPQVSPSLLQLSQGSLSIITREIIRKILRLIPLQRMKIKQRLHNLILTHEIFKNRNSQIAIIRQSNHFTRLQLKCLYEEETSSLLRIETMTCLTKLQTLMILGVSRKVSKKRNSQEWSQDQLSGSIIQTVTTTSIMIRDPV